MKRRRQLMLSATLLAVLGPRAGRTQAWPTRPIKVVVPFPPGGFSDIVTREVLARAEAAIRKGLLPLLFGEMGLARAKQVVEQVVQITLVGLGRA